MSQNWCVRVGIGSAQGVKCDLLNERQKEKGKLEACNLHHGVAQLSFMYEVFTLTRQRGASSGSSSSFGPKELRLYHMSSSSWGRLLA